MTKKLTQLLLRKRVWMFYCQVIFDFYSFKNFDFPVLLLLLILQVHSYCLTSYKLEN